MFFRQQAFTGESNKKMLKGGLHCHTTRSDGKCTPEEVIRLHAENGYDFLAITDHRCYNFTNYAPDSNVLIIPGIEVNASLTNNNGLCFHTVSLGPAPEKNGFKQDERIESGCVEDWKGFQRMVDELKSRNNIAFYCHPDWSRTPARSFENIEGYFAMEIWNSSSAIEYGMDVDNGIIWDELLVAGKPIYAVAVDDGHAKERHCNGWVRVKANKDIDSILTALTKGEFYSSCGPEIYDFYVEGSKFTVKCSPAAKIYIRNGLRPSRMVVSDDASMTEAEIDEPRFTDYVRAVVEDAYGRRAWTNPIYLPNKKVPNNNSAVSNLIL